MGRFGTMPQMAQATNSVLLYAALFLLAATVVALSIGILKLLWRERRTEGETQRARGVPGEHPVDSPAADKPATEDPHPREAEDVSGDPHGFSEEDYLPPRNKLNYRLRYEPIGKLAKEKRLKAGMDRQNVRVALFTLASKGTYVFEDLMTEEGPIDFLTLSRSGMHVVLLWTDEGYVWRDTSTDVIIHAEETYGWNPDTGYERLLGDPLPENPDVTITEVTRACRREVGITGDEGVWKIHCFTRAEIQRPSEYTNRPWGMCATIDLARWIDWEDESEFTMTEERVHELAAITEEVYSRKPIVRPLEVESGP